MSASQRRRRVFAGRDADDAPAWVLLSPAAVPERWRGRGRHVVLVPLLAQEAAAVLAGEPAAPALDERDERLAGMVLTGASISEMARAVGLSRRGVGHRLARLRERFGVATTTELVAELARLGFPVAPCGNATPQGERPRSANHADERQSHGH